MAVVVLIGGSKEAMTPKYYKQLKMRLKFIIKICFNDFFYLKIRIQLKINIQKKQKQKNKRSLEYQWVTDDRKKSKLWYAYGPSHP